MTNIAIYLLSIEECYTLNGRILNVFKTDLSGDITVNRMIPRLEGLNNDLAAVLNRPSSSSLTKQLAEKDSARNSAFIVFRDYCKAFVNVTTPEESEAAKTLVNLIKKLGWSLHREGYMEQTATQQALVKALKKPKYVQAVNVINATDWVQALEATNLAFEAAVKLKNETIGSYNTPLSSDCKRNMVKYLKPLLAYVEMMVETEPDTYTAALNEINEIIENAMAIARSRQTRREGREVEETEETEVLREPRASGE